MEDLRVSVTVPTQRVDAGRSSEGLGSRRSSVGTEVGDQGPSGHSRTAKTVTGNGNPNRCGQPPLRGPDGPDEAGPSGRRVLRSVCSRSGPGVSSGALPVYGGAVRLGLATHTRREWTRTGNVNRLTRHRQKVKSYFGVNTVFFLSFTTKLNLFLFNDPCRRRRPKGHTTRRRRP